MSRGPKQFFQKLVEQIQIQFANQRSSEKIEKIQRPKIENKPREIKLAVSQSRPTGQSVNPPLRQPSQNVDRSVPIRKGFSYLDFQPCWLKRIYTRIGSD